jgi:cytochrome c oxidase subunit 1
VGGLTAVITAMALLVGYAQDVLNFTQIGSRTHGAHARGNPWNATPLDWQTPHTPPRHGNFAEQPVVYRWAYDYSVPGAPRDFIAQNDPWVSPAGHKAH